MKHLNNYITEAVSGKITKKELAIYLGKMYDLYGHKDYSYPKREDNERAEIGKEYILKKTASATFVNFSLYRLKEPLDERYNISGAGNIFIDAEKVSNSDAIVRSLPLYLTGLSISYAKDKGHLKDLTTCAQYIALNDAVKINNCKWIIGKSTFVPEVFNSIENKPMKYSDVYALDLRDSNWLSSEEIAKFNITASNDIYLWVGLGSQWAEWNYMVNQQLNRDNLTDNDLKYITGWKGYPSTFEAPKLLADKLDNMFESCKNCKIIVDLGKPVINTVLQDNCIIAYWDGKHWMCESKFISRKKPKVFDCPWSKHVYDSVQNIPEMYND